MAYTPNASAGPNGGRINMSMIGNTAGTASAISTGTFYLAGGSNVTLSQNANTVSVSAMLLGGTRTLSRWEAPEEVFTAIGAPGNGSLSIQHLYIPYNISASAAKVAISQTFSTQLILGNNGSMTLSLWMGMYKLNGSTLTTVASGSASQSLSWNINAASAHTGITGLRQYTVPMNVNITPGEYWMGAVVSSSVSGNMTASIFGNNLVTAGTGISNLVFSPLGSTAVSVQRDVIMFQGIHTSVGYTMPNSIAGSQINNTAVSAVQLADYYGALYNETNF